MIAEFDLEGNLVITAHDGTDSKALRSFRLSANERVNMIAYDGREEDDGTKQQGWILFSIEKK